MRLAKMLFQKKPTRTVGQSERRRRSVDEMFTIIYLQEDMRFQMNKRTLGSSVREARDGARMTQRDLAAAIVVKSSHIEYIENGSRKPSIAPMNRLAETLGT
jgi:ribosome-binding protein aMBF1 (putative translation factor)